MSNHFSADNLKFPGDGRRLELTDRFGFKSAGNPDKTVLIIDSNPMSAQPPVPAPTTGPEFRPDAVYQINIGPVIVTRAPSDIGCQATETDGER